MAESAVPNAGRFGGGRAPHEGPLAFGAALIAKRPEVRTSVLPLLERYAELR